MLPNHPNPAILQPASPQSGQRPCSTWVVLTTIGLVLVDLNFREQDGGSTLTGRFHRLKAMFDPSVPTNAPTIRDAFANAPTFDLGGLIDFSIKTLIVGLEKSVARA